ncbi:MAG TPA: O-antigen ligase family protein [Gaiellaceae bacterium]|nr:O-antigen ligase family protein [Gaiellaceae bacterium]
MHPGLLRGAGAPAGPLLLVGSTLLIALALFAGDGSEYEGLVGIGTVAFVAAAAAAALGFWGLISWPRLGRSGYAALLLLAAFVLWNGLSVVWSIQPDRSWEYFNRGVVYLALLVLGLFVAASLPRAPTAVAWVLTALLAAAMGWALLGKVVPDLFPDGERIARLREPIGYWNGLALLAALALPLGVWLGVRKEHPRVLRVAGPVLLFVATVTLFLTYSRGGVLVALATVAASVAVFAERVEAIAALAVSLVPAAVLAAWALSEPGLVENGQTYDDRLRAGLVFGALLVVGIAAVGVAAYVLLRHEERLRPRFHWRLTGRRLLVGTGVALLVGVLAASRGDPIDWARDAWREFTNPVSTAGTDPTRLASLSSNSRWTWWEESWEIYGDYAVGGAGAGTFALARRPIRVNTTHTLEPHNMGLQALAETGIVGFLLLAGAVGATAVAVASGVRRLTGAERAAGQALALGLLAYFLHGLIDYDWDFVALTAPIMLVLGVLLAAGRVAGRRGPEPLWAGATVLVAAVLVFSLASPWFASRAVASVYEKVEQDEIGEALDDASRARALNPLSIEPLLATAVAEEARADDRAALERYVEAVELQPRNWRTWYELGRYELSTQRTEAAVRHLQRSRELDPLGPANDLLLTMGL